MLGMMPPPMPDTRPAPSDPPAAPPSPAARQTRAIAVGCLLTLIALGLAWELWLAPLRPGGSWWALKVLPLAPALGGLMRYRMRTYRWLALLVWLYFVEGVVRAFGEPPPASWLAAAQVLLALALFAACTAHIRLRQRHARKQVASTGSL